MSELDLDAIEARIQGINVLASHVTEGGTAYLNSRAVEFSNHIIGDVSRLVAEVRRLRERLLKCHWVKYNRSDFCLWETTCGHSFQIDNDYSPSENGMRFCSYCGKELIEETESQ